MNNVQVIEVVITYLKKAKQGKKRVVWWGRHFRCGQGWCDQVLQKDQKGVMEPIKQVLAIEQFQKMEKHVQGS